jgi:hypothetical protein
MHTFNASPPILLFDEFMVSDPRGGSRRRGRQFGGACRVGVRSGCGCIGGRGSPRERGGKGSQGNHSTSHARGRLRPGDERIGLPDFGLRGVHFDDQTDPDHSRLSSRGIFVLADSHRPENRRDVLEVGSEKASDPSALSYK